MKKAGLLLLLLLPVSAFADYFTDMFTGTAVNSAYWRTYSPYSDSSVVQSGGAVTLTNSGKLYSANQLNGTFDITFKFAFTGSSNDSFRVWLRSFGIGSNERVDRGVAVSFRIKSDTGQTAGNVAIENQPGGAGTNLAVGTFQ